MTFTITDKKLLGTKPLKNKAICSPKKLGTAVAHYETNKPLSRSEAMQQDLPFDPNFYYGYVADNLLKNLGQQALQYADQALIKMKNMGDDEGFNIWLSIHEHLAAKSIETIEVEEAVVH